MADLVSGILNDATPVEDSACFRTEVEQAVDLAPAIALAMTLWG